MKMEIEDSLEKAFGLAAAVFAAIFAFDYVEDNYDYIHAKLSGVAKKNFDDGFAAVTKKEDGGAEDITD